MRWPRRVRAVATGLDFGVRLDEVRPLDDIVWGVDVPMMVGADTIVSIVGLGLFLSATGIFELMNDEVALRDVAGALLITSGRHAPRRPAGDDRAGPARTADPARRGAQGGVRAPGC